MSGEQSAFQRVLELARADDPGCGAALAAFTDPELVGELMVQVYRCGTPAGREALAPLLNAPFRRGVWQGFKRIFKLAEAELDAATFARQARVLDGQRHGTGGVSYRTLLYMQRRCYRHLKGVAVRAPERLLDHVEALLARYEGDTFSVLVQRLLRTNHPSYRTPTGAGARFAPPLENDFAATADEEDDGAGLLDLDDAALLADRPPADAPAGATSTPPAPPAWKGPIFPELWTADPERLLALLAATRHDESAAALVRLLDERVGERMLAAPTDALYRLLAHPHGAVWRFALRQLAARARSDLLRFDELVPLLARAGGDAPDWEVVADLLHVLDDERAEAARAGLGEPLRDLVTAHPAAPGVGPVVAFFRLHLAAHLGPPVFGWEHALALAEARRPDVRELGRDVLRRLGAEPLAAEERGRVPSPRQLGRLLASGLADEAPELIHELLTGAGQRGLPQAPPADEDAEARAGRWSLEACAGALDELPAAGFAALRRALLWFDDRGALSPDLARLLVRRDARRTRRVGLDLLAAALGRGGEAEGSGRVTLFDVVELAGVPHEDVVVWARERLADAAGEGRLENEALYRMLDAALHDVRGFGRELVREHLRRFQMAELIVFCAESPDAATADLGIELYERELRDQGYDLRALLPMFRILLYKVATARREKDRLYGTLERWALEAPGNGRLVVDVVAAFRRTEARIDFTRAVRLLVAIGQRFPQVELPFAASAVFGAVRP